jgi:alpha-methylacyl-CoA racemase
VPPLNLVGDYAGGTMFLAFGMVCALLERARSGRGQVVDAAMTEGVGILMSMFHGLWAAGQWQGGRGGNLLDSGAPFYDVYACADGRYMSVGALEPKFFAELARLVGLEERFIRGQYDRALWPELRTALAAIFATRPQAHWAALLEGTDACAVPVLNLDEAPLHKHNAARGAFARVGEGWHPAPAPRFSRTPGVAPAAPQPEVDPGIVLRELGYTEAEITGWRAAGIIRGSEA